ncbi:MAG: hypothetical protein ACP5OJ_05555 [Methanothermobacter sp.]
MSTKYCPNCGMEMDSASEYCAKCGFRQMGPAEPYIRDRKSPGLAAILSFLIVGLGQIYNGQIGKGLLLLLGAIISGVLVMIFIGIIFWIIIWVYAIYDAYDTAKRINLGEIIT